MSITADTVTFAPPRQNLAGGKPGLDWMRAFKALRRLLDNKEDTAQVFEIMRALNGPATPKGYMRLLRSSGGGRIAYAREELAERLMDDAWLDSFAPGTVGAAYRHFVRSQNLSAEGLVEESRRGIEVNALDAQHPYAWFGRRTRDVHDIWHVLSGYGRDGLGEACLVAFSYAQTKGLGWALIALGAMARSRKAKGHPYGKAIREGYARGRAAAWLLGEDYDVLLNEPLESARRRLRIGPARVYDAIPADARDDSLPIAA